MPDPLARGASVVTGAAGDIGRAVCRRLASDRTPVVALDRTPAMLEDVVQELRSDGLMVRPIVVDVADWDATRAVAAEIVAQYGGIDTVACVAGRFASGAFVDLRPVDVHDIMADNFGTTVSTCAAFLPHMQRQQSGSIVTVASSAGEQGAVGRAAGYAAAKGAIVALTKSLAREFMSSGIRVNCVSPGPVRSRALRVERAQDAESPLRSALEQRAGAPAEVAEAVAYLASSRSSWTTGEVLRVNGGLLM